MRGHDDEGFTLLAEAATATVEDGDEVWRLMAVAHSEGNRAWKGRAAEAVPALDRALARAEALGNEMTIAGVAVTRGTSVVWTDVAEALDFVRRGVSSSWGCYGQAGRVWALHIAAGFMLVLGEPAGGVAALAAEALDVSWDRGLLTGVAFSLLDTGGLAIREGRLDAGARILADAEAFARQHGIDPYGSYELVHDWIVALADEHLGPRWRDHIATPVDIDRALRDAHAVLAALAALAEDHCVR